MELRKKVLPDNYPEDALRVLRAMSLTEMKGLVLHGSMALRSQQYAGDYDGYEVVEAHAETTEEALDDFAKRFQNAVRRVRQLPDTYISDIKAGVVRDWLVLRENVGVSNGRVVGYSGEEARERLRELRDRGVVNSAEYAAALPLLVENPTPEEVLRAMSEIKFHILRWTPTEVLLGEKTLRDGRRIALADAFHTPGLTKMDVVSFVQNSRFTDFSVIYEFRNRGKTLNPTPVAIERSLQEDILALRSEGEDFKALKREFALAKFRHNRGEVERLTRILNSDLGRLYQVVADIDTLVELLRTERPDARKVRFELDQFRARLANVYQLRDYLSREKEVLALLRDALASSKGGLVRHLEEMREVLSHTLNAAARKMR